MLETYYGYIYKTKILDGSERYYIGQHILNSKRNIIYYGSGIFIKNYIQQYGTDKLEREILEYAKSKDELDELEYKYVNEETLKDPLCLNVVIGGNKGSRCRYSDKFKQKIINDYLNGILSKSEILIKYHISESALFDWLQKSGLDYIKQKRYSNLEKDNICNEFIINHLSVIEICKKYNIGETTLRRWLKERNISFETREHPIELKRKILMEYFTKHIGQCTLGKKYNISSSIIFYWVKHYKEILTVDEISIIDISSIPKQWEKKPLITYTCSCCNREFTIEHTSKTNLRIINTINNNKRKRFKTLRILCSNCSNSKKE